MGLIEKLKAARKNAKMTQEYVESQTGINSKTISNWENGVSKIDIDSVAVLCRLYGIDPNGLFEWPENAEAENGEDWTVEEESEIENYKAFIRAKRNK